MEDEDDYYGGAGKVELNVHWVLDAVNLGYLPPKDLPKYSLEVFLATVQFSGMVFTIMQYDAMPDALAITKDRIREAGGGVEDEFDPESTTHLILQYAVGVEYDYCQSQLREMNSPPGRGREGSVIRVATLHWVHQCLATKLVVNPQKSVLNYPSPPLPVVGALDLTISVTGYMDQARVDIKDMAVILGAAFTGSFTRDNTTLIAPALKGDKCLMAREWGIPIVNHLWLEDSLHAWRLMPVNLPRYTTFPEDLKDQVNRQSAYLSHFGSLHELEEEEEEPGFSQLSRILNTPQQVLSPSQQPQPPQASQGQKRARNEGSPGRQEVTGVVSPVGKMSSPEERPPSKKSKTEDVAELRTSRTPALRNTRPRIALTGFGQDEKGRLMKKIAVLNGECVDTNFTHLITNKIARTIKFLEAICQGCHILSAEWVLQSSQKGAFQRKSALLIRGL